MAAPVLRVTGLLCRVHSVIHARRTLSSTQTLFQTIPNSLWKLGRLNHVALAVPDLEKARSLYENVLGAKVSETVPLPEHGVYTIFVELGNTKLELLHPLGEKSPISGFLQKNKAGGMHHICIEIPIAFYTMEWRVVKVTVPLPIQLWLIRWRTAQIILVDDIKSAMADLKEKNIRLLSDEPRIGAHGKPVVFLHPKDCDGVLVELEEA